MSGQGERKCYVNVFPLERRDVPFVVNQLSVAAAAKGATFLGVTFAPKEERVLHTPGAWLSFSWLEYDVYLEVVDDLIKRLEEDLPKAEVWIFHDVNSRSERLKSAVEEAGNG